MRTTLETLAYTDESTKADQRCGNCQLYTAKTGDRGKCQLFAKGLVSADGWCSSWTKMQEAA